MRRNAFFAHIAVSLALTVAPAMVHAQQPAPTSAQSERRVDSLLKQMTLEEKIGLLSGVNFFDIPGLDRLGIPARGTADSPFGVRAVGPSTLYAGGIGLAASWNTDLAKRVGTEVGRDARARGKAYSLGPGVNLYRSPLNGRNFEYYGEDPFLASRVVVGYVTGMQSQGVSATIKHFLGNESEYSRNTTDSRIDERTLREMYLPPFEAAVKEARVGAVMDSYNLTNGTYMTANKPINVDLLKSEWGFDGVLMSDWGAVHDAVAAANGGTDLEMPGQQFFTKEVLLPLVKSGTITESTIDDKVRRLLRNAVRFGWLDRPQLDPSIPRYNEKGRQAALQGAREAMVLLKNDGKLLPLDAKKIHTVAIIGPNAFPGILTGGGSATIPTFHSVSYLEGIAQRLGTSVSVVHARGLPSVPNVVAFTPFSTAAAGGQPGLTAEEFNGQEVTGTPATTRVDRSVNVGMPLDIGVLASGEPLDFSLFGGPPRPIATRWTGWYTPRGAGRHDIVVQQGGFSDEGYRLYVDDKLVADRWSRNQAIMEATSVDLDAKPHKVVLEFHSVVGFGSPFLRMGVMAENNWADPDALKLAKSADAVVVAVGFDAQSESEGWDRTFGLPPGQDALIERVAAVNKNVVVVVTSGGGVDMTRWVDKVPTVLEAWYPGQEGGTALAELLFGDVNPSGHLPVTFERKLADDPSFAHYYPASGSNRIDYAEGVFGGYRGFEKQGTATLFPFGHGMSYTTFSYGKMTVTPVAGTSGSGARWQVSFDVTNTGNRTGAAVPQLYVGDAHASVPRPPKELKGFAKIMLRPGETRRVTIPLDTRSLAYYDVDKHEWRVEAGDFDLFLGRSSADIVQRAKLTVGKTTTIKVIASRDTH